MILCLMTGGIAWPRCSLLARRGVGGIQAAYRRMTARLCAGRLMREAACGDALPGAVVAVALPTASGPVGTQGPLPARHCPRCRSGLRQRGQCREVFRGGTVTTAIPASAARCLFLERVEGPWCCTAPGPRRNCYTICRPQCCAGLLKSARPPDTRAGCGDRGCVTGDHLPIDVLRYPGSRRTPGRS